MAADPQRLRNHALAVAVGMKRPHLREALLTAGTAVLRPLLVPCVRGRGQGRWADGGPCRRRGYGLHDVLGCAEAAVAPTDDLLDCLSPVTHKVEAVGHLHGLGRAAPCAVANGR